MAIIKKQTHKKNYTVLENLGINDSSLSFKATGLWAFLMSKPVNWQISLEHLARVKKEGKEAVRAILLELSEAGYLVYHRFRTQGRWDSEYLVFETPQQSQEYLENLESDIAETVVDPGGDRLKKRQTSASSDEEKPPTLAEKITQFTKKIFQPHQVAKCHVAKTDAVKPRRSNQHGATEAASDTLINKEEQSTDLSNKKIKNTLSQGATEFQNFTASLFPEERESFEKFVDDKIAELPRKVVLRDEWLIALTATGKPRWEALKEEWERSEELKVYTQSVIPVSVDALGKPNEAKALIDRLVRDWGEANVKRLIRNEHNGWIYFHKDEHPVEVLEGLSSKQIWALAQHHVSL